MRDGKRRAAHSEHCLRFRSTAVFLCQILSALFVSNRRTVAAGDMVECNASCITCPMDRVVKIREDSKNQWFCSLCGQMTLCPSGVAWVTKETASGRKPVAVCGKCKGELSPVLDSVAAGGTAQQSGTAAEATKKVILPKAGTNIRATMKAKPKPLRRKEEDVATEQIGDQRVTKDEEPVEGQQPLDEMWRGNADKIPQSRMGRNSGGGTLASFRPSAGIVMESTSTKGGWFTKTSQLPAIEDQIATLKDEEEKINALQRKTLEDLTKNWKRLKITRQRG